MSKEQNNKRIIKLPKMRIPLPKQRCQAFKDKSKYTRKGSKGNQFDSSSFLCI